MKSRLWLQAATILSALLLPGQAAVSQQPTVPSSPRSSTQRLAVNYAKLPLSFEANQGQTDPQVKFLSRGPGYTLFLTANEAVLRLKGTDEPAVLRLKLVGANPNAQVNGLEELPGRSNYFLGNDPAKWRTNVPHYARVRFENIYPGIDLVYYGTEQGQLEYDFIVHPGADPATIRLATEGALKLTVDTEGNLTFHLARNEPRSVSLRAPKLFQVKPGPPESKQIVAGHYVLNQAGTEISFSVGLYDPRRPLVIDPILGYSTYLGGQGFDFGLGVAVDLTGSAYLVGDTGSADFPTTNPLVAFDGTRDAFVAKFNSTGSALLYSTFLGGNGADTGFAIALGSDGSAYVTGVTRAADFPVTPGAPQSILRGVEDVFVSKLDSTGSALLYSTYLGGTCDLMFNEESRGIAVDALGNAHVTGFTCSTDFPAVFGSFAGQTDAFVTKINAEGTALVYSRFLGGIHSDFGRGIALDADSNTYVTGDTASSDFPTTPGAFDLTCGSDANCDFDGSSSFSDGFVTKLNPTGSDLVYSTFLGGSSGDGANGIAVDGSGSAFVTGFTTSSNFPVSPSAFQAALSGSFDAVVTRLDVAGSALLFSTYLGGTSTEVGLAIALDASGNACVTGQTASSDFPKADPLQANILAPDAVVVRLNSTGSGLLFSTPLGGSVGEIGHGIAVDASGRIYVTGNTNSLNFPTTTGAFQTNAGNPADIDDAFLAKIMEGPNPAPVLNSLSPASVFAAGPSFTLTLFGSGFVVGSEARWNGSSRTTRFVSSTELRASIPASDIAAVGTVQVHVFTPSPGGGTSQTLELTINPNPQPHITSIAPSAFPVGTPSPVFTIHGSGFVSTSVAKRGGADRPTTFVNGNQLQVDLPASDVANPGAFSVSVANPSPGGGTSNVAQLNITSPVLSALFPHTIPAGSDSFVLTISGANFHADSVARWKGGDRPTAFLNSAQLAADIPASDLLTAGSATMTVRNCAPDTCSGDISNSLRFTISLRNPLPTVTGLSLPAVVAGAAGFLLGVTGSNFVFNSEVRWDGAPRATTFLSSSQLQALIPATDLEMADIGSHPVTVFNPGPGGGASNAVNFNVLDMANPPPMLASIDPTEVVAGSVRDTLTLMVTGADFLPSSVVRWSGMDRLTSFINANQLMATIPASDLVSSGIAAVTVFTPSPGGGTSLPAMFTLNNPAPTLNAINPNTAMAGDPAFTLTVLGSNFVPSSVVRWNGADRPTSFIGSNQLRAAIPAADLGPQKSPDPYSSGHILVNRNDSIVEVTLAGEQLLSVPIPWPDGPRPITEDSRDLIIDSEGNIVIYNGTFDPFLSTLDPTTITWTHRTHSGWSTINNGSYGGIGRFQNLVFVTDMTTFGSLEDQLKGIIRFDLSNNTSVRFADAQQYEDLTVGLDGMLYALRGGNTIDVYHPATLQFVRTFSLPVLPDGTRGIAVNASGEVFGAAWDGAIRRYDPNGNLQDTLVTGVINLSDIDLAPDGTLIAGSQLGDVIITNETLDGMSSFAVGGFQIFVAFGTLGTALVTAANPAPGGGVSAALPFTFNVPSQATTSAMPPALPPPPSAPGVPPPAAQPAPRVVAAPAAASSGTSLPAIESLRPATIVAGSGTLKLSVKGENFTEESVVRWKGKGLPTKFRSSTELEVELPAEALAQPGEVKLTVFTPGPAGGSSRPATLTVTKD